MPRLLELTEKELVPPEAHAVFDAVAGSRGSVRGPFAMLMHSPETAGRTAHLGAYLRFESMLPAADRELAIIATARAFDCAYEWAAHVILAREAGVREEAVEAVARRASPSALNASEATIVSFARELLEDRWVSDDTFNAARKRYGDQGVVELTATVGYYAMMACTLAAFQVEPDPTAPQLPAGG